MDGGFRRRTFLQARRGAVAGGILAAGFLAGVLLFVTAPAPPEDLLGDQANQSKQYLRQMEEYGGTANVLASKLREWFDGLWRGKTLGVTVFCLSALLAVGVFLALTPLPPTTTAGEGDERSTRDDGP